MASLPGPPPLTDIKVIELAGLAPGPFTGLLLADAGADVLRVDRPTANPAPTPDSLTRHKRSLNLSLTHPGSLPVLQTLLQRTDILIDPYRPGVLERLSLSPTTLIRQNPRLIICRLTGYRRTGPYSQQAGHDINYLAVSGILSLLGEKEQRPLPPGNLLADFAGGGAVAFMGILMALLARDRTGRGQVVEANMVDGVSYLASFARFAQATSVWDRKRGDNVLDGACPWYGCYRTADGKWMSVGALEDGFFDELLRLLDVCKDGPGWPGERHDRTNWPRWEECLEERFASKTREEWEKVFLGCDACVAPVLELGEMRMQGFDQRPVVGLSGTPLRAVSRPSGVRGDVAYGDASAGSGKRGGSVAAIVGKYPEAREPAEGQGKGVEGEGWTSKGLVPGEGGEEALKEWLGWSRGREYDVDEGGGFMVKEDDGGKAKL